MIVNMASGQSRSPKGAMIDRQLDAREEEKIEAGGLWVEIRIPTNADLSEMNLTPIYRWIYNEAREDDDVFEFVVAGMKSTEGEGMRTRYFIKAPDYERKRGLWNRLEAREVVTQTVDFPPDFSSYDLEAEFEMNDDFAIPLIPEEEIDRGRIPAIPEQLAAAVKDGGALRIVIKRDDNAGNDIQRFINKEEGKGGDPLQVLDGLFDNLFSGRTHDGVPETRREKPLQKEETEYSRLAKDRKNRTHVHCEIRAYGNERQIRGISKSFGFELNDIVECGRGEPVANRKKIQEKIEGKADRIFSLVGRVSETEETLRESLKMPENFEMEEGRESLGSALSKYSEVLNKASETADEALETLEEYREGKVVPTRTGGVSGGLLKAAHFLVPLLLVAALVFTGTWSPRLDFSSSLNLIKSLWPLFIIIAGASVSWLWLFGGRGKNPIVMTTRELSAIGSLPSRPQSLPVEFETPAGSPSGSEPVPGEPEEKNGEEESQGKKGESGGETKR